MELVKSMHQNILEATKDICEQVDADKPTGKVLTYLFNKFSDLSEESSNELEDLSDLEESNDSTNTNQCVIA